MCVCRRIVFCKHVWNNYALYAGSSIGEILGKFGVHKVPFGPSTTTWNNPKHYAMQPLGCTLVTGTQFLGVLYGKIGKMGKMWTFDAQQLRNRTSYERNDQTWKLPSPWSITRSEQYLSAVRFLGHMHLHVVAKFGETLPLESCRKCLVGRTKKNRLRETCRRPHFVAAGSIAPEILQTSSPIFMCMYMKVGPDRLEFARVIPERLICWAH